MNNQTLDHRLNSFERKQYLISTLCLLVFTVLSVFLNSFHLKSVAQENTKFLSRMIKIGDFREVTLILQEARLSSFTKIHYLSSQPEKSFILPPRAELFDDTSFWKIISTQAITVPVVHGLSEESSDQIVFEFDRFRLLPYAILLWISLNIVSIPQTRYIRKRIVDQYNHDIQKEVSHKKLKTELSDWMSLCEEKDLVCRQIHHDLASPLGLLKISTQKLLDQNLSKPFALSLDRLTKISEDLKTQKYIWSSENPKLENLKQTLDSILQEKRLLTSHTKIQFSLRAQQKCLNKTPDIPISQLHRVLSNVLNNAIEAIQTSGHIRVISRYNSTQSKIDLIISDSGTGISPEIAPYIFEKQKSFNKSQGSGLGLYHAKQCLESFGGELLLLKTSQKRKHGAAFLLRLPLA